MRGFILTLVTGLLLAGTTTAQQSSVLPVPSYAPETPIVASNPVPDRVYLGTEYLLWWIKDDSLPPLLTIGPPASGAALGTRGTTVLAGGGDVDFGSFDGGRFTLGFLLDDSNNTAIETGFFFLGSKTRGFNAFSRGDSTSLALGRPFLDVTGPVETTQLVAFPNALAGVFAASTTSRLWGLNSDLVLNGCRSGSSRLGLLVGLRYLRLEEDVSIGERLQVHGTVPVIGGTGFAITDQFDAESGFFGGRIGGRMEWSFGDVVFTLQGSLAAGWTHQELDVRGATIIRPVNPPAVYLPAGLLALRSNSGSFDNDEFSVVPELGINVSYQILHCCRVMIGYSAIYWTNVIRAGDQIDRGVNPAQIPSTLVGGPVVGQPRPAILFHDTDFWAQGISLGVEFRF